MITKVIMMKKYLESSKQLIENCEFLYVPTVRLTQKSRISPDNNENIIIGLLYGSTIAEIPTTLPEILQTYDNLNLSFKFFDNTLTPNNTNSIFQKFIITAFVNEKTDKETQVFQE